MRFQPLSLQSGGGALTLQPDPAPPLSRFPSGRSGWPHSPHPPGPASQAKGGGERRDWSSPGPDAGGHSFYTAAAGGSDPLPLRSWSCADAWAPDQEEGRCPLTRPAVPTTVAASPTGAPPEPAASVRPPSPQAPGQFRDGGGKRPRAGSSSSAETRAPFWAQRVGRLCPQAFREGGERWGREPPGAQGLNGGPGGVAWPGVHAHCDRSPGLFPRILHTKVRKIHGL